MQLWHTLYIWLSNSLFQQFNFQDKHILCHLSLINNAWLTLGGGSIARDLHAAGHCSWQDRSRSSGVPQRIGGILPLVSSKTVNTYLVYIYIYIIIYLVYICYISGIYLVPYFLLLAHWASMNQEHQNMGTPSLIADNYNPWLCGKKHRPSKHR